MPGPTAPSRTPPPLRSRFQTDPAEEGPRKIAKAPQSVTRAPAGDLTLDEYLASLERQQPPPYGSLPPPAYEEDPPPPYTSLDLQEINEHRTNFIDVGLITDTASTSSS
ncbi:hypothetical protein C0J52_09128 [Blattella germanica]|nr:hypothetical protein C0J52_09128 [Blattella germanica]